MLLAGLTLDLDITYILVLALILIPLLVLNSFVFGPFMKLFEQRHEQLTGALARASKQLDEAEEKAKAFEEKIAAAATRGTELRSKIRADAQRDMSSKVDAERRRMAGVLAGEIEKLTATRNTALQAVQADASRLAELTATKLLGRGV